MAHYQARAQGNKSETTRCGTHSSGITARVDSWSIGARSVIKYDPTGRLSRLVISNHYL